MPERPPRLHHVFQRYDPPLYFVTFNTNRRRRLLANASVQNELVHFAQEGQVRGIGLGRYVIMPDHIQLFVRGTLDFCLRQWVRMLRRALSTRIVAVPSHWQPGFLRSFVAQ
ncbi:MAG: hypothetical protein AUI05_04245 [Verrucomicrobia bacterium 13_2_20CM_2_54_15_9cls]|nr:MAG: hypothetical protein AUI05_04245 [Verrucomicrobia bacterium 13_2_20CM_2_54_15_9cls]